MTQFKYLVSVIAALLFLVQPAVSQEKDGRWQPTRINKCIELWQSGQPIYYAEAYGGYDEGKSMAQTWADYIIFNMEHKPIDFGLLRDFMQGLVDGGPTPSGHRTPTVIAIVPVLGIDENTFMGGSWMIQQVLAQGVHGIHLVRARDPEAVKRFVQAARYPIHKSGTDLVGEGLRGFGSHKFAAKIWGVSEKEYLQKADIWPLNPDGEIILGIKIEDRHALDHAEESLSVPGIAFAEHGPRDMGLSYGYLEGRADPPVPAEVDSAGAKVLRLCKKLNIAFLDNVLADNVEKQIDRGVMIGAGRQQDAAEKGRRYTGRKMPW